ncbi:hypothetical protein EHM76_04440 [bacterium]|nr:MAG: hypothetical protein EHM76_04440 [bacterium]
MFAGLLIILLSIVQPMNIPTVESPRLEEWGFCIDPATDSEVERCGGGLSWAIDLEAKHLFLGE